MWQWLTGWKWGDKKRQWLCTKFAWCWRLSARIFLLAEMECQTGSKPISCIFGPQLLVQGCGLVAWRKDRQNGKNKILIHGLMMRPNLIHGESFPWTLGMLMVSGTLIRGRQHQQILAAVPAAESVWKLVPNFWLLHLWRLHLMSMSWKVLIQWIARLGGTKDAQESATWRGASPEHFSSRTSSLCAGASGVFPVMSVPSSCKLPTVTPVGKRWHTLLEKPVCVFQISAPSCEHHRSPSGSYCTELQTCASLLLESSAMEDDPEMQLQQASAMCSSSNFIRELLNPFQKMNTVE